MNDRSADPVSEFRRVNVEASVNLARQAADAGVRRFVFLSSIKVNGEGTESGKSFMADDIPLPLDPYGLSKLEAQQELEAISRQTGIEIVIIRPPLVYGPGVKANFKVMMRWLDARIPLPFGAITQNRRSLVALENLVSLISASLIHPAAANRTFLVSDGEDLSTAELLRRMGSALGKPARLFFSPPQLLKIGAMLLNKPDVFQRLCGSLQVDIGKTIQMLDWKPVVSVDEGLCIAARDMLL